MGSIHVALAAAFKKIGDSNGKRGTVVHSPLFLTALIYVGCVLGCLSHLLEFSLSSLATFVKVALGLRLLIHLITMIFLSQF